MKLIGSAASPYVRKVRVVLAEKRLDYQFVIEEVHSANSLQSGSVEPRVRADMTFFETPNDGAVFSVGSISFGGSLPVNGYDNPVARITENVVRGMLADGPLPGHAEREMEAVG